MAANIPLALYIIPSLIFNFSTKNFSFSERLILYMSPIGNSTFLPIISSIKFSLLKKNL